MCTSSANLLRTLLPCTAPSPPSADLLCPALASLFDLVAVPVDDETSSSPSRSMTSTTALADALLVVRRDVDDATRLLPERGRPVDVVTGSACDGRGDEMPTGVEVPLVAGFDADACSRPSLNRWRRAMTSGLAAFLSGSKGKISIGTIQVLPELTLWSTAQRFYRVLVCSSSTASLFPALADHRDSVRKAVQKGRA